MSFLGPFDAFFSLLPSHPNSEEAIGAEWGTSPFSDGRSPPATSEITELPTHFLNYPEADPHLIATKQPNPSHNVPDSYLVSNFNVLNPDYEDIYFESDDLNPMQSQRVLCTELQCSWQSSRPNACWENSNSPFSNLSSDERSTPFSRAVTLTRLSSGEGQESGRWA
jgi:hypothetical protein